MMRAVILTAVVLLFSTGAMAEQTCVTRADGSYNCTTTVAAAAPSTTTADGNGARMFAPDATGLLRVPTQDGEMLFHCDNVGPCKQIGLNPLPLNRQ